ncbi:hypothetical protein [Campylobacter sp. 19-13652]|uniref:hypothetical protein n=1 Tax=Campylobacter sp. 19-13652 TaxID=2840180 RepID=UPI001C84CF32|nr:hypothetical protein [Campylobacter sp. 19-13652]
MFFAKISKTKFILKQSVAIVFKRALLFAPLQFMSAQSRRSEAKPDSSEYIALHRKQWLSHPYATQGLLFKNL